MDGAEAPAPEDSPGQDWAGQDWAGRQVDVSGDADCVITTVVDGNDVDDVDLPLRPTPSQPTAPAVDGTVLARLAAVEAKLAPIEGATEAVTNLHQAVAEEFQRHVGALAGQNQTLVEFGQVLVDLMGRMETVDARGAAESAAATPAGYEQALSRVVERIDGFDQRLAAAAPGDVDRRVAGLEERVEAMAQLPAVVRALRVALRADEEILAGEVAARERAEEASSGAARADAVEEVAARLTATEARLVPLVGLPDDVGTLSRIVRREIDAVTAAVQASEQVLRRALQKEIERLREASAEREEALEAMAPGLALLERNMRAMDQAHEDAAALTTHRVEEIEARLGAVDGLVDDVDTLRSGTRREVERLRASAQTHDQSGVEMGRRFVTIEDRLARLDALPGEVQAQRSAIRQDVERTIVSLRSIEERTAEASARTTRHLRQLADSVTEAHQRGASLASESGATRAAVRTMGIALTEVSERLASLERRLAPSALRSEPFPEGTAPPG